MIKQDTIVQELKELGSSLAHLETTHPFEVPQGYFEGLASGVLAHIKALEAANVHDELLLLSPVLDSVSRKMPYEVPAGYFETLASQTVASLDTDIKSAGEELESISPLLSSMNKKLPFGIPDGYFDDLAVRTNVEESRPPAKIVTIVKRTWFRVAAAAMLVGIIVTTVLVINKKDIDPNKDSYAWVKNKLKKVSAENLDAFTRLVEDDNSVVNAKPTEIKELIKDVPENELESFLKDTEVLSDPDLN